jgi:hypothetical protein
VRETPIVPSLAAPLYLGVLALVLVGEGAVLALLARRVRRGGLTPTQRGTLAIVAWVLGLGAAFVGGAHYLLSSTPWVFVGGVAVLLAAFGAVPPPGER